ncbi:IclR family transcriptional regulator [Halosolutus amylolyticus]|uniref:IclR family transcriptional regulator n=1 Tax=Halosolutus amylolyticus TaxID=2932267 RepID=A0ABD5PK82_9EURY|nr:IclR family transcriptional regulator [Halosolutus amylolyticus]
MGKNRNPRRIQAVDHAFEILGLLRDHDGMTVSEIANAVGLTPGTVHTHLTTMQAHGVVQKTDGKYQLGTYMIPFGENVRSNSRLFRAGKTEVDDLAAETGESVHLVVETLGREVLLYEEFGQNAVGEGLYLRNKGSPGRNLHCSAAGKAILAHMDEKKRETILDGYDFTPQTPNTITDEDALRDELQQIREENIARNDEEQIEGVRAVGCPIRHSDEVLGAISLSAPTRRFEGERFAQTIPEVVAKTANIIEVEFQTQ